MTKNRKDLTPRHISRYGARKSQPSANIRVVIRVRPPNSKETGDNHRAVVKCREANSLTFDPEQEDTPFFFHGVKQRRRDLLKKQHKNLQFVYDRVFPDTATNEEVFCYTTRDLIDILMDGCNCSVFAYGATGAGKTYTMLGKPDTPGITVLTIGELFARKEQLSDARDFELFVTYLEVYNENVRDLLKHGDGPLQLREDAQIGVTVAGLTHKKIACADELFHLLDEGNKNRTQHPTDANAESSRSHAVFQVYLKMTVRTTGQAIMAKLSMIDLAGSERGAATGCKGLRFTEGANINKSLLALGNCINSLADGQKHVPYRDSKLTRILKDSLGGNCHTVMIANVSPSSLTFEDTYNTLKYATRAKKIKANVKKNVMAVGKTSAEYIKTIEALNEEIRLLKEENAKLKARDVVAMPAQTTVGDGVDNKEEITTTTHEDSRRKLECFTCVTSVGDAPSAVAETVGRLFDAYTQLENKRHSFVAKQRLQERRTELKDEVTTRLGGALDDAMVVEAIDRLRRRPTPHEGEINALDRQIVNVKEQIGACLEQHPELKGAIDAEHVKLAALQLRNDKHMYESLANVQAVELRSRGEHMQQSAQLLRSWHALLHKRGLVTTESQATFDRLRARDAARLDDGDSGMSTTSSTTSSLLTVKRSGKRKLDPTSDADRPVLDSTYVQLAGIGMKGKASDNALFKDLQPTPKKVARGMPSPRIRNQKENKGAEMLASKARRAGNVAQVTRAGPRMIAQGGQKPPFR